MSYLQQCRDAPQPAPQQQGKLSNLGPKTAESAVSDAAAAGQLECH